MADEFVQAPAQAAMPDRTLHEALDAAPVLIWRSTAERHCDWFNRTWLDFTGRRLEEEVGQGWVRDVHPEDLVSCQHAYDHAFQLQEGFTLEFRLRRHDGRYRWVKSEGRPFHRNGRFAGYIGSCIDIHGYRESERRHQQMVDELNHRVRNMLSVVQAIARQSLTGDAEALLAFNGRLMALAGAHDVLVTQSWIGATLQDVLQRALQPWSDDPQRVLLDGPVVPLRAQAALTFAIAAHELCTNAVRHGALSAGGHVEIAWGVSESPAPQLALTWHERGGPTVQAPARRGFGSVMLERVLAAEVGGTVKLEYPPDGFCCRVLAPLEEVLAELPRP
ncbi:MAG: HWE histidine kinase domain-containing protein [Pseudoxanthomonas sp.]